MTHLDLYPAYLYTHTTCTWPVVMSLVERLSCSIVPRPLQRCCHFHGVLLYSDWVAYLASCVKDDSARKLKSPSISSSGSEHPPLWRCHTHLSVGVEIDHNDPPFPTSHLGIASIRLTWVAGKELGSNGPSNHGLADVIGGGPAREASSSQSLGPQTRP